VFLLLSPWPETYCISLSEAQSWGLVPIVTALGAQAERVSDGVNGFHVPANDASAVVRTLQRLLNDSQLLNRMAGQLPQRPGSEVTEFMVGLKTVYDKVVEGRSRLLEIPKLERAFRLDELDIALVTPRWLPEQKQSLLSLVTTTPTRMSVEAIVRGLEHRAVKSMRPMMVFVARQISRAQFMHYLLVKAVTVSKNDGLWEAMSRARRLLRSRMMR
jgi:hypothetical protein